uniref:Protein kinase domain-containing protein n=1 Tax=Angiostrongylus cantonensis TaxID=6313 RepID=A0A0K0DFR1_ANGCA
MTSMMFLPDFGLNTNDIRYLSMDSIIGGNGPNRLKYLDLEGRWNLSGKSVPYITSAFGHLENLNYARVPFNDISSKCSFGKKPTAKFQLPVSVLVNDDVPVSPRESVPHRSAGYGPAHQKRKLLISNRSRSTSPVSAVPTVPTYDKYAKYERNRTDSMTRYGTKWGCASEDSGYSSAQKLATDTRPPHRTPALSPRISSPIPSGGKGFFTPTFLF